MYRSESEILNKILLPIYLILYSFILALSIAAFMVFRPGNYIDNDHSYIRCQQSKISYETSPNFIFALDKNLDPFNDVKARKLCGLSIIKDYDNVYPAPKEKNYIFLPAIQPESSWFNALFGSILTFIIGTFVVEFAAKLFLKKTFRLDKQIWSFILYLFE